MPINPVQFAHSVCDEFLRYLFSAFPLSDPELAVIVAAMQGDHLFTRLHRIAHQRHATGGVEGFGAR